MVAEQVDGFHVASHQEPNATVVTVQGELDMATAPELRDVLAAALASAPARLVVDASLLTFVDSTGLSTLLLAERRCRAQGGELVLRSPTPGLQRLVSLSGVDGLLRVDDP